MSVVSVFYTSAEAVQPPAYMIKYEKFTSMSKLSVKALVQVTICAVVLPLVCLALFFNARCSTQFQSVQYVCWNLFLLCPVYLFLSVCGCLASTGPMASIWVSAFIVSRGSKNRCEWTLSGLTPGTLPSPNPTAFGES